MITFRRSGTRAVVQIVTPLLLATIVAACGHFGTSPVHTPVTRPLTDGETIGSADRSASAGDQQVRTLLSLTCTGGRLAVRTRLEGLKAATDCAKIPPQSVLDRYLGQAVMISYAGGHLKIENPSAGTIDLVVDQGNVTVSDATP